MRVLSKFSLEGLLTEILKKLEKSGKSDLKEVRTLVADAITDIAEIERELREEYAENDDIFLGDVFEHVIRGTLGFNYFPIEDRSNNNSIPQEYNEEIRRFIESVELKYGTLDELKRGKILGFFKEFGRSPNEVWLSSEMSK